MSLLLAVADVLTVTLQPTIHRLWLSIEPGGERELDVEVTSFTTAVAKRARE